MSAEIDWPDTGDLAVRGIADDVPVLAPPAHSTILASL